MVQLKRSDPTDQPQTRRTRRRIKNIKAKPRSISTNLQVDHSTTTNPEPQQQHSPITPTTNWAIALFFLLLATIFGYRKLLINCLLLPLYSIALILLFIAFNLGLAYWIHSQDLQESSPASNHSIDQKFKSLHDRLNFSTPAAYSAALIKKSWENQTEWRMEPLHPSLQPKTSAVLDRLIAKIMRDFVWKASRSSMIPCLYSPSQLN